MSLRAAYRRMERESKKKKSDYIEELTEDELELKRKISSAVKMEQLAKKLSKKELENNTDEILKAIANQAYSDWCQKFEKEFIEVFLISFSMAIHEKFPRWGTAAISRFAAQASAWTDRYIMEYNRDLIGFRNLYAIAFGEPFQLQLLDPDTGAPIVSGNEIPKSDIWKAVES